jgi:hypothetical protein
MSLTQCIIHDLIAQVKHIDFSSDCGQNYMSSPANSLPGVPMVESPLFSVLVEEADLSASEIAVARSLNERGYAVIDFPDAQISGRIDRIKTKLAAHFGVDFDDPSIPKQPGQHRVQDAWKIDEDVRAIAANSQILTLLEKLYGRPAFPFQTLNFPVGTEQHPHSDAVHFSTLPERFMCGVWLALEDTHPDAGPLAYYPGSHKWPIVTNAMIGRRGWKSQAASAQLPFEKVWHAMLAESGIQPDLFFARKGQALIWAANLLHGGSAQTDHARTRWSQVTHYYFKDCIYYTPAFSDEALGRLDLRSVTNITTGAIEPNLYLGEVVRPKSAVTKKAAKRAGFIRSFLKAAGSVGDSLPNDFDASEYYRLNPDISASGADAVKHYLDYGLYEGRRYKID